MRYKEVFHENILLEITKFLDRQSLSRLMRCDKDLLRKIGKSSVWTCRESEEKLKDFQDILPILIYNPLIINKIIPEENYDYHYYFSKYFFYTHQKYKYVFLSELLKSSKTDLENFGKFIEYYFKYDTNYIDEKSKEDDLSLFKTNLRRIEIHKDNLKKSFESIPQKITNLILLDGDLNLGEITLNMDNKNHALKIISKIGYFSDEGDELILPECGDYFPKSLEAKKEYFQYFPKANRRTYESRISQIKPDKYGGLAEFSGTGCDYIEDSQEIKRYFNLLGKRLGVKSGTLLFSVKFTLEIFDLIVNPANF